MNKFVTGAGGMVGTELVKRGYKPLDCDVSNEASVKHYLANSDVGKNDLIVNCAALTDVDYCEQYPSEALNVNTRGVHNIVSNHKGKLIQISTDHVFSGDKWFAGGYSEKHKPDPVNVYGRTKLAGETMALYGWSDTRVIRTSKLFNREFLDKKLEKVANGELQEFTSLIQRSFLHVKHFVDGLEWVANNWSQTPKILNISGIMIMSYFGFFYQTAMRRDLNMELLTSRIYKLDDAVPRPFRCGLNIGVAKKLGVPLYSLFDGIKLDD